MLVSGNYSCAANTRITMTFKDHFSGHSKEYSAFRPRYPAQLFCNLASLCAERDLAWDCATGSGQAAVSLAAHFRQVTATDASANQISNASPARGVRYSVAHAENSGLESESVDLITVAQALHWFKIGAFAEESDRVLKDEGVLAVWTYGLLTFGDGLNPIIEKFYSDVVGDYWPFERKMVEGGYADIEMPFDEISTDPLQMTEHWTFTDLIGFLNTWSAVRAYQKELGSNPLRLVHDDMLREWGDPATVRVATWPLIMRVWRKTRNQSKKARASVSGTH
jgi:ubiquinone/menaquinone biosynthesis C-methylase UbiE